MILNWHENKLFSFCGISVMLIHELIWFISQTNSFYQFNW